MSVVTSLQPPLRATMTDVARAAGVSIKTVSRVVNEEAGVSEELAARVRRAADELGYRPNLGASHLRRRERRTASIGVLVQDLGNAFCGELLRAVEHHARSQGVVVISASLDEEAEREHELVRRLVERRCDGVILMPATLEQSYLLPEIANGLRVVVVDRVPGTDSLDAITADNRGGAHAGVTHLISHGHRRIGCLTDIATLTTARERAEGYRAALADVGIAHDPALDASGVRSNLEAGDVARRMLTLPDPPTAFFTGRNVLTRGVVRTLQELGRAHDVAIVGFDDLPEAELIDPPVTTVVQDAAAEGKAAVDLLLARLEGLDSEPVRRVLPTRLVVRGSGELPGPAAG